MKVEFERLAEAAALGDAAAWQALWSEIEPILWGITGKWQITGPLMCLPFCNKVVVAGVNLGSTPIVRRRLDPGRHNVELWRGDKRSVRTVHVRAGKTSTLTHRAPRATSCNPPYTIDKSGLKRMKAECLEPTPPTGGRSALRAMKAELKAKVAAGTASKQQRGMLRALCRQLGDHSCMN